MEAVTDAQAEAAALDFTKCGGNDVDHQVVQPPAARQSDIVADIQDAARVTEQAACMFCGHVLQESLGRDAGPTAEQPLEMRFAVADVTGNFRQLGLPAEVPFQVVYGGFD